MPCNMNRPWFNLFFPVLLFLGSGCSIAHLSTPERLDHGLVIVLPGIEGRSPWNINLAKGLAEGGVDCGIEIFDWGTPVPGGWLLNLTDIARNRTIARKLRDRIRRYQNLYPSRPVHLVGHSGGAGMALMATEILPPEDPITSIILLGAAISPEYNLRPALQRVTSGIHNCYSHLDTLYLGAGTFLAGTIDRQHVPAAGQVGFSLSADDSASDQAMLAKLHQWEWTRQMWQMGNDGGHMGWTDRRFARCWIAPLLQGHPADPVIRGESGRSD